MYVLPWQPDGIPLRQGCGFVFWRRGLRRKQCEYWLSVRRGPQDHAKCNGEVVCLFADDHIDYSPVITWKLIF